METPAIPANTQHCLAITHTPPSVGGLDPPRAQTEYQVLAQQGLVIGDAGTWRALPRTKAGRTATGVAWRPTDRLHWDGTGSIWDV